MTRKHWRKHLKNNLLPPKYQLVSTFSPLIDKLVDIVWGSPEPRDLHRRLHSAVRRHKLSVVTFQQMRDIFSRDDVRQQCYLFLLEIWEWCVARWKPNRRSNVVFYDFVRALLPRYLGAWMANQIKSYSAGLVPGNPSDYILEVEVAPQINLGWVMIKQVDGPLSTLSVKQKYLLYLRYSKQMTILEIAGLIDQHRAKIEQEFSVINKLIEGVNDAPTRNYT